jgi:hypothetical protein
MSESFCPRISEAKQQLPLLRAQLVGAASRYTLPADLSVDLLPIVEAGLFGYELVPDRSTSICLTIGFDEKRAPVLRKTSYGTEAPTFLRLAAQDGRAVIRNPPEAHRTQQRDSIFSDLQSAVESTWDQLGSLFPDKPRQPIELDETPHRVLDEALHVAHSHLAAWDPFIEFFGIPNEAQQGFALRGANGARGELLSTRPDIWILRWKAPPHAVYEEWSVVVPGTDAAEASTRA